MPGISHNLLEESMRALVATLITLGFAGISHAADEDKLDMKFLVGTWTIKYVDGKNEDTVKKTIEFNEDGTYVWMISKRKEEGTYTLKGNKLELTRKGNKGTTTWNDLSIKDGKIIHPGGKTYHELTREEKK
jgi:uncharacterized protein (TIGR03066 family)